MKKRKERYELYRARQRIQNKWIWTDDGSFTGSATINT
jgi:hypothetical protein